ncbi:MAG TPA: hypothetical protein VKX25_19400 [Bryobacteraceae bacterium]|jgi:hypothetical protein|nr:hypothetical protein [Bryobacteraceae bacterium]
MDQVIPLTSAPNQTLTVALSIDGGTVTLRLQLRYNEVARYWVMTISDRLGNLLVDSIPLLTGFYPAANLLQQQRYLAIGSAYVVNASGVAAEYPTSANLGSDFQLIWSDTPTV